MEACPTRERDRFPFFLRGGLPLWARVMIVVGSLLLFLMLTGVVARL
ncbi:MAG: hypothetical protein ACR2H9_14590 [Longimicrobiaceae bacterium]